MHYLLSYDVINGDVRQWALSRHRHLEHARRAVDRGELILAGPLANPVDGGVLLFRGESPAVAESFAKADPYVLNGLVLKWRVRKWTTRVGAPRAISVKD